MYILKESNLWKCACVCAGSRPSAITNTITLGCESPRIAVLEATSEPLKKVRISGAVLLRIPQTPLKKTVLQGAAAAT